MNDLIEVKVGIISFYVPMETLQKAGIANIPDIPDVAPLIFIFLQSVFFEDNETRIKLTDEQFTQVTILARRIGIIQTVNLAIPINEWISIYQGLPLHMKSIDQELNTLLTDPRTLPDLIMLISPHDAETIEYVLNDLVTRQLVVKYGEHYQKSRNVAFY